MANLKVALKLTEATDPKKRFEGIKALGELVDRVAIDKVRYCLSDNDPNVRAEAARTLAKYQEPVLGKYLVPLLRDPELVVRQAGASAIGEMKYSEGKDPLSEVAKKAGEPVSLRQAAVQALLALGASEDLFLQLIDDAEPAVRVLSIQGLKNAGADKFQSKILPKLRDGHPDVRLEAANALSTLDDDNILQKITPLLQDPDTRVREKVVDTLAATGKRSVKEPLMSLLADPSTHIRGRAKKGLEVLCDAEESQARQELEKEREAKIAAKKYEIGHLKDQITSFQKQIQDAEKAIEMLQEEYKGRISEKTKDIEKSYGF